MFSFILVQLRRVSAARFGFSCSLVDAARLQVWRYYHVRDRIEHNLNILRVSGARQVCVDLFLFILILRYELLTDVIGRLHILVLARVLRKALPLKNNNTCLIYKQSLDQLTLIFRFCAPYLKYFLKHFKLIIFLLLKSQVVKIRIHVTYSFKSI